MKRGFVRILFGEFSKDWIPDDHEGVSKNHQFVRSRSRTQKDIRKEQQRHHKVDFVTYVYGKENQKVLDDLGFQTVLLHDDPYMWWPEENKMWWHKLHAYRHIMNEDKYDEFVYLDWDCVLNQKLFDDFWTRLGEKETFQAALCRYGTPIIAPNPTRQKRARKIVPNGGFVYMRDNSLPDKIWEFADVGSNRWLDEAAYAKYVDNEMGGWIGTEKYWDLFEPEVCRWNGKGPYKFKVKDNCFRHR